MQRPHWPNLIPWLLIGVVILILLYHVINGPSGWLVQPLAPTTALNRSTPRNSKFPIEWRSLLSDWYGDVAIAPIYLDGRPLFWVTAPVVAKTSDAHQVESITAQQRAQAIQQRLQAMTETKFEVETLTVTWKLDEISQQPVIYVNNQLLLTVTALDTQLSGEPNPALSAEALVAKIQQGLVQFKQERTPTVLRQRLLMAFGLLGLVVLLNTGLNRWHWQLSRQRQHIASSAPQQEQDAEQPSPRVTTALRQQLAHSQQRKLLDLQQLGIRVGQLLGWIIIVLTVLGLFPTTRGLQPRLFGILHIPAQVITIGLLSYGVVRLGGMMIERFFLALEEGAHWAPERSQRLSLRFSTFLQVTQSIFTLTIVLIAILSTLALWGVQVAPLLAGAGIVGIGISLASQSLIKDFINGFLIVLEDQFGLGDFIVVGDEKGMVEKLNLRVTQLRDAEGGLITIPNGQIAVVRNLSKEWSRVDLQLTVDPTADVNQAMGLLSSVAEAMSREPQWQDAILETPNLLGVDNLNHLGTTLRLWVKTVPLQQWAVARELRRRVKQTFDQAGITIGIAQQRLQVDPLQWQTLAQELQDAVTPASVDPSSGSPPHQV